MLSVEELVERLRPMPGMAAIAEILFAEQIDEEAFFLLTPAELRDLGIVTGPRVKIMAALRGDSSQPQPTGSSPPPATVRHKDPFTAVAPSTGGSPPATSRPAVAAPRSASVASVPPSSDSVTETLRAIQTMQLSLQQSMLSMQRDIQGLQAGSGMGRRATSLVGESSDDDEKSLPPVTTKEFRVFPQAPDHFADVVVTDPKGSRRWLATVRTDRDIPVEGITGELNIKGFIVPGETKPTEADLEQALYTEPELRTAKLQRAGERHTHRVVTGETKLRVNNGVPDVSFFDTRATVVNNKFVAADEALRNPILRGDLKSKAGRSSAPSVPVVVVGGPNGNTAMTMPSDTEFTGRAKDVRTGKEVAVTIFNPDRPAATTAQDVPRPREVTSADDQSMAFFVNWRRATNVVVLGDSSGSMKESNRLDCLKKSLLAVHTDAEKFGKPCHLGIWNTSTSFFAPGGGATVRQWIDAIHPNGGTEMEQALTTTMRTIANASDVFVLCDGQFEWSNREQFIQSAVTEKGTRFHFVALGADAVKEKLQQMAVWGNGTFAAVGA